MMSLKDTKYKSKSVFSLQDDKRIKLEFIKKKYQEDMDKIAEDHALEIENLKREARENRGKLREEIRRLQEQNEELIFEHKKQMAELEMTNDEEVRRLKLHIEYVTSGSEKAVTNHKNDVESIRMQHSEFQENLAREIASFKEKLKSVKKDHNEAESLLKNEIFGIKTAKKETEARHRQVIDDLWKENATIADRYQKQLDEVQREKERIEQVFLAETGQMKQEWRELKDELQKFKVTYDFTLPSPQNTVAYPPYATIKPNPRNASYPSDPSDLHYSTIGFGTENYDQDGYYEEPMPYLIQRNKQSAKNSSTQQGSQLNYYQETSRSTKINDDWL